MGQEPGIDRETAWVAGDQAVRERTDRIKEGEKETGYLFLMWIIWPIIAFMSGSWGFLWMLIPATVVVWVFQRSKAD
jgi:nitrate reductase NapE component